MRKGSVTDVAEGTWLENDLRDDPNIEYEVKYDDGSVAKVQVATGRELYIMVDQIFYDLVSGSPEVFVDQITIRRTRRA